MLRDLNTGLGGTSQAEEEPERGSSTGLRGFFFF